jgi:hypothetical protein
MKQKDLATIGIAIFVAIIVSFIISGHIFTTPKNRQQSVETISLINSKFPSPNAKYFNSSSVNATQLTTVQQNSNANPFTGGSAPH